MSGDLQPYPQYVDSGVAWLGTVPSHWSVLRCKYIFREIDERSATGEETHLSMSQKLGLIPSSRLEGRRLHSESYAGGKLCQPNDLVLNRLKAHLGVFARANDAGVLSPDYTVLRPLNGDNVTYFEHVFKSPRCTAELRRSTKGIVEGFWRLYTDDFYNIRVPVPPANERDLILRFVAAFNGRVRKFVRNRRRLIQVLSEQKQAIVNEAVTRGLDSSVSLKSSGVSWLGDVPEHWDVLLNQRIFKEQIRPHNGRPETPLSLSQRDGLIATSEMKERSLKTSTYDNWKVTIPGDLVANRFKAHLGVFFASTLRGIVSFHYGVFEPRVPLNTKYFELLYHTNAYKAIYAGRSNGMTVGLQNLSNQNFYSVRTILPPLSEQEAIVEFAEMATANQERAIRHAMEEVDLIKEYRTRLIADVVTGKLDVRHLAPPPESFDAEELSALDTDEGFDDDLLEEEDAELVEEVTNADD